MPPLLSRPIIRQHYRSRRLRTAAVVQQSRWASYHCSAMPIAIVGLVREPHLTNRESHYDHQIARSTP